MKQITKQITHVIAALALTWSAGAMALILGPADADKTVDVGPPNPALDAGDVAALFGTSDLTLLYKSNYEGPEEGSYQSFYSTSFTALLGYGPAAPAERQTGLHRSHRRRFQYQESA